MNRIQRRCCVLRDTLADRRVNGTFSFSFSLKLGSSHTPRRTPTHTAGETLATPVRCAAPATTRWSVDGLTPRSIIAELDEWSSRSGTARALRARRMHSRTHSEFQASPSSRIDELLTGAI